MNSRNLLTASLVGGLVSIILVNVPILNFVNCILCAGFWAGPLLAVWMYKRQTGTLSLAQGIGIGALAGVWAGVFGFLLSFVGLAGAGALMQSYAKYLPPDAGVQEPLAGPASILFNLMGVGIDIIFGVIGGLIGGAIFKSKPASSSTAPQ